MHREKETREESVQRHLYIWKLKALSWPLTQSSFKTTLECVHQKALKGTKM